MRGEIAWCPNQRTVLNTLLADILAGTFTGILTWVPDRLSRNAVRSNPSLFLSDSACLTRYTFTVFYF